jgi:Secretion system C-terminal sorting domain
MKKIFTICGLLLLFFYSNSQNLKRVTANVFDLYTNDVEQIPEENSRVLAYSYTFGSADDVRVALVKLDQFGNILFNRGYTIPNSDLRCQQLFYIKSQLYALFYMNTNLAGFYKPIVVKIDVANGDIITSDVFDGYTSNGTNTNIPISLSVFNKTVGLLSYGYNNNGGIFSDGRCYFIMEKKGINFLKAFELKNPTTTSGFFFPSNIGLMSPPQFSNSGYFFDFSGIYEDGANFNTRRTFFSSYQKFQSGSATSQTHTGYQVDGIPPANSNIIHWDVPYIAGQNISSGSGNGFGDVFWDALPTQTGTSQINTFYNFAFELQANPKNKYNFSVNSLLSVPFGGAYQPTIPATAGYVSGFLGVDDITGESILQNNKYRLNVSYLQPALINLGIDNLNHSDMISGIVGRAGTTGNKFYYWYNQEPNCSRPIEFSKTKKNIVTTNEPFNISEVAVTSSPITLTVSAGPFLSQEDICHDAFSRMETEFASEPVNSTRLNPELPHNINSWKKNNNGKTQPPANAGKSQSATKLTMTILPNPAKSTIWVTVPALNGEMSITNMQGQNVYTNGHVKDFKQGINISKLGKGTYLLKYSTQGIVLTEKFMVE